MHLIHLPRDIERVSTHGSVESGYGEFDGELDDAADDEPVVPWRSMAAADLDGPDDADDMGDVVRHFSEL